MRINRLILTVSVLAALLNVGPCFGQQATQSCDVPFVITRFDQTSRTVQLVQGLTARDLILTVGNTAVPADSVSASKDPKRIALVLDASQKVPEAEWKLEVEMAASLVDNARHEDGFVLFLTGLETTQIHFLSSGDMKKRIIELKSARPAASDSSERNYDALMAAASSLNPPRFGDVIFLFGHPDDDGSAATYDQVRQLIIKDGVRFYGESFSDPFKNIVTAGSNPNSPLPKNFARPSLDQLSPLTGYFFSYHSLASLAYPGQTQLLKKFLADLYAGIATPYRIGIPSASIAGPTTLEINVSKTIDRPEVHYPHFTYPCSSPREK